MATLATPVNEAEDLRSLVMRRLFHKMQALRMNELYFQERVGRTKRLTISFQVISALAASAAFVGLLAQLGPAWLPLVLSGIAGAIAAVSPIMHLEHKLMTRQSFVFMDAALRMRVEALLRDLKRAELDGSHLAREAELDHLEMALSALDDGSPDAALLDRAWEKVVHGEMPSENAWDLF